MNKHFYLNISLLFLICLPISSIISQISSQNANYIRANFKENKGVEIIIRELDNEIHRLILERSADGINYEQIKIWDIKNGLFDEDGYKFIDESFFIGFNYYKTFAISEDEGIVRSHTTVTKAYRSPEEVLIYPNPSTDWIHVSVYEGTQEEVEITLSDAMGKVLIFQSGIQVGEHWHFKIDVSDLATGTYFIRVKGDIDSIVLSPIKFYVQRPG